MAKTAAMHWGEVRAERREDFKAQAEAAMNAEEYGEVIRLANLALRHASRNNPKAKAQLTGWRTKLLSRIPSKKTLEKRRKAKEPVAAPTDVEPGLAETIGTQDSQEF